jgi:hypothetical protein
MTVTRMMMNDDVDKDPAQKITDRKKDTRNYLLF